MSTITFEDFRGQGAEIQALRRQISEKRIKHPSDILKVGDVVNVRILKVDVEKGRISLTMKNI